MAQTLTITTFNPTGLGEESRAFINELLHEEEIDILCSQEIWKYQKDIKDLDDLHGMYMSHGVSGLDASKTILHGRLYGGVGILYHKRIAHLVKPFTNARNRCMCGIHLKM